MHCQRISMGVMLLTLCTSLHANEWSFEPSMRWRYQDVSDPFFGDGTANTILVRGTANFESDSNWTGLAQVDHVSRFRDDYSDGVTLRNASFIPDPEGTEFNQLWLAYDLDIGGTLKLGRQSLSRDNERHVGGNSFWQNEQTFDALSYSISLLNDVQIDYAYVRRVNRIFGPDAGSLLPTDDIRFSQQTLRPPIEQGVHDHRSHLLDVGYAISNTVKFSGYWYALDNRTFRGFSSHTLGARLQGNAKPDTVRYEYRAELAAQTDAFDSPWRYTAHYVALSFAAQRKSHKFELSYENIGSDNGFGFVHSLGSNHQFQGWADLFAQYRKPEGIADTMLTYRGRSGKLRWRSQYHVFYSSDHDVHVGNELDLELAWRATRKWELSAVLAHYMAENGFVSLPESQQDRTSWFVAVKYNL